MELQPQNKDPSSQASRGRRLSPRKQAILEYADRFAVARRLWIEKNTAFHRDDKRYMRFLIPEGLRVLDLGCDNGELLAALKPSQGLGVDLSPAMIEVAASRYPEFEFRVGDIEDEAFLSQVEGPFDVILLSDTIGYLEDCEKTLRLLHRLCTADTRLVIVYDSRLWDPLLDLAEALGQKMPQAEVNDLSTADIENILHLADFQVIKREWRQLLPRRLFGIERLVNSTIATLPGLRRLCLRNYIVARSVRDITRDNPSVTVLIPCRNERGTIESALVRMPRFATELCPGCSAIWSWLLVVWRAGRGALEERKRLSSQRWPRSG